MKFHKLISMIFMILISVAVITAGNAYAQDLPPEAAQIETAGPGDDHIIVETYDVDGSLISTDIHLINYDSSLVFAQGNGGSSSASGCKKVTVRNEKETVFGFTAYWFNTWTRWCWNRANRTIDNVTTGWYLDDVDQFQEWQGLLVDLGYFFYWKSGYSTSGFYHEKQGHFMNCIPNIGCVANSYPRNQLWSHSDGTWRWRTSG